MFWIIRAGVRSAARAGSKPQGGKPKEWTGFTKLVWFFFLFAIPIAAGGGYRVGAIVTLALIVVSTLFAIIAAAGHAAAHRDDKPADPLAGYFADKPKTQQGSKR